MSLWGVRGQKWAAPALWRVRLPVSLPSCDHAGPTDRQGAGVAVQTQSRDQIWRFVHGAFITFVPVITDTKATQSERQLDSQLNEKRAETERLIRFMNICTWLLDTLKSFFSLKQSRGQLSVCITQIESRPDWLSGTVNQLVTSSVEKSVSNLISAWQAGPLWGPGFIFYLP